MAFIEGVFYTCPGFKLEVPRWDFPDQGISCVLGESGSGKTTFLQMMAGLIPSKNSLKLSVAGKDLTSLPISKRRVSFVFQDYALFPHMTAFENVLFAAEALGLKREEAKNATQKILKHLSLERVAYNNVTVLSGGEKQRVALARALVAKPNVVLLDEPFSSLDEDRKDGARLLIANLAKEFQIPFVLVTHDYRDVRRLSQNILFLKCGKVLGSGSTSEILSKPSSPELAREIPDFQILRLAFKTKGPSSEGARLVAVRKWDIKVTDQNALIEGKVIWFSLEGPYNLVIVETNDGQIIHFHASLLQNFELNQRLKLTVEPKDMVAF